MDSPPVKHSLQDQERQNQLYSSPQSVYKVQNRLKFQLSTTLHILSYVGLCEQYDQKNSTQWTRPGYLISQAYIQNFSAQNISRGEKQPTDAHN